MITKKLRFNMPPKCKAATNKATLTITKSSATTRNPGPLTPKKPIEAIDLTKEDKKSLDIDAILTELQNSLIRTQALAAHAKIQTQDLLLSVQKLLEYKNEKLKEQNNNTDLKNIISNLDGIYRGIKTQNQLIDRLIGTQQVTQSHSASSHSVISTKDVTPTTTNITPEAISSTSSFDNPSPPLEDLFPDLSGSNHDNY